MSTLLLTILQVCVLWLLSRLRLVGNMGESPLSVLVLLLRIPVLLLVPLSEIVVVAVIVLLLAEPLAVARYLRMVRTTQKGAYQAYMPLTNMHVGAQFTAPVDAQNTTTPLPCEEQRMALPDLIQQESTHQFILGDAGAGKTLALRVYQYLMARRSSDKIPVYVPLQQYALFLEENAALAASFENRMALLDFLVYCDLPSVSGLRPYLAHLAQRGRLLLLCDGFSQVDRKYVWRVSEEIVQMMRTSDNQLVVACRAIDYRDQQSFVSVVEDGYAALVMMHSLQFDQIGQFVEQYVERQDKHWHYTAGQIMQVIERSRLRYYCTNPLLLSTLLDLVDSVGIEQGKQLATRGCLLRESVGARCIKPTGNEIAPSAEDEVIRLLSEVACAARWSSEGDTIQLPVAAGTTANGLEQTALSFAELADALQQWLAEHPAQGIFVVEGSAKAESTTYKDAEQLLLFASSCGLIEISSNGVLSFPQELIASYFVAEYFCAVEYVASSVRKDLLDNVERWGEPIALWAGLLDDPLPLSELFGRFGQTHPEYRVQALVLSLICVGVAWTPPPPHMTRAGNVLDIGYPDRSNVLVLPPDVAKPLALAVRDKAVCEELACVVTRCAAEGGQEIYYSLLPLLMVEGIEEFFVLLDQAAVPDLLFAHLQDSVDKIAYEAQVKRLIPVLGRFGDVVVERAVELSLPNAGHSARLRAAAVNILGGTHTVRALAPLIARLSDTESFIVNRAVSALIRLGPELALSGVLQELENPTAVTTQVRCAVLTILGRFIDEREQVTMTQYQAVLEKIVLLLTASYGAEPELQQQVREIFVRQCSLPNEEDRCEKVVEVLLRSLLSQDEVAVYNATQTLQEIGPMATPRLVELLRQYQADNAICMRVIEILKAVRDVRALPHLLRLIDDPSPVLQKQVASALLVYTPDCIMDLIALVLSSPNEMSADRAAQILGDMGEQVVMPITNALSHVVPERTRLLVQTLGRVGDQRAVPVLIELLQVSQVEPLLTIAIVRALSQFPEQRVVSALLPVLSQNNAQVYEEAINALGQLGEVALPSLLTALDVRQETVVTQRVRRALVGMQPFPAEQLVQSYLAKGSDAQVQQIMFVLRMQGADAAHVLVRHLLDKNARVRGYVYETLEGMPGAVVVPALLEVLRQPELSRAAAPLLLTYPDAAVSPLVELLGEYDRGNAAAAILPQFGPQILRSLLAGLDDQRSIAQQRTRSIMVTLVRQSNDEQAILREMVHLFNPPPPLRAHHALLELLSNELADCSMFALREALEDVHLIKDVSEVFKRLSHKVGLQGVIFDQLLEDLFVEERRRGVEEACIKIGAPIVPRVGELITHANAAIADAAKYILVKIGVPALAFIWSAHSDPSNRARREAAHDVFRNMPTDVIRDELIDLLVSEKPEHIAMATTLLLERIYDETVQSYADREMIPELIEYVQTRGAQETNLRIIALLLLLGEHTILDHLIQALDDFPQQRKQFLHIFLLLGSESQEVLLEVFNDPTITTQLRAEIATVLGMMTAPEVVVDYAQNVSTYGLSTTRTSPLFPEQLAISLRAVGGLLAGGYWNIHTLQQLSAASKEGSPNRELFNVLLGMRYEPQLAKLRSELQEAQDTYKKEALAFTARIVGDQQRIQSLEEELEQLRHEHGVRGDQLQQATHDKEKLRSHIDRVTKDHDMLRRDLDRSIKERDSLREQLSHATRDSQTLRSQLEQLKRQLNAIGDTK
ncbi:MAG: HEAT repeat domain-containing protein [Ktedonobacteraceae bacterium]|nr:HEAT repeat domain-containing protein [Ktedonobacteraceae bacterium]